MRIVEETPKISTRVLARRVENIEKTQVHSILRSQQLYPFHLQRVQALLPQDFEARLVLCRWLCEMNNRDLRFIRNILFTDEATFTRNGMTNIHNTHIWAEENPKAIVETHHQVNFKVNVWAGVVDNFLLGPVILPGNLTGHSFLLFLQNTLPDLLDDLPLQVTHNIWFQLDGAPPHFARNVRNYLHQIFPNRWIGRGRDAPVQWPPRSPDLTPLDYSVWGCMKDFVYMVPILSENHLRERILQAGEQFRLKPNIFQSLRFSLIKRARMCLQKHGGHIEPFL